MKSLFFIAFTFFLSLDIAAQSIGFDFDYAQFGYDSVSNYVEFYYSFNQSTLNYVETDSVNLVQGILYISIMDTATGEVFVDKNWLVSSAIKDTSSLNQSLVSLMGFVLNKGTYKCVIKGSDASDSTQKKSITEYIVVNPFIRDNTAISGIQLASNIKQGSENTSSIFYKNTYEIVPAPSAIFSKNQPVLFYYSELYNIKENADNSDLRFDQIVANSKGQIVNIESKKLSRSLGSRVEVGKVVVPKLPTDTYTLVLNLIDSSANYGVSSSKRFFVYNPDIAIVDTFQQTTSPVLSTMFGAMSEEELDDLFAKSKYIATPAEAEKYKVISTVEAKREFLYNFWKTRDDNPSDEGNNYFRKYLQRIKEANLKFTALKKEGWKTDRGRVYLIYGEPSEIERYPNQIETRPYEIWHYQNIEGGAFFVFADITGFSDYQLVHSTKRGELRDDNWERRIFVQ